FRVCRTVSGQDPASRPAPGSRWRRGIAIRPRAVLATHSADSARACPTAPGASDTRDVTAGLPLRVP
ncbi:hypothetical protein, partial [Pseudoneobacillus sp. C159]